MLLEELLGYKPAAAVLFEDNLGCIFLIKNQQTTARTKHIDIKYHWVRELYENNKILPEFVRSEFNYADGLTKNQPEVLFKRHMKAIRSGNLDWRREDDKYLVFLSQTDNGKTCSLSEDCLRQFWTLEEVQRFLCTNQITENSECLSEIKLGTTVESEYHRGALLKDNDDHRGASFKESIPKIKIDGPTDLTEEEKWTEVILKKSHKRGKNKNGQLKVVKFSI
jgi:hypothetical protein